MVGLEERTRKAGVVIGPATVGLDLKTVIEAMKPGEMRIVGTLKKFIVRYDVNEIITIIDLSNGIEIYRG